MLARLRVHAQTLLLPPLSDTYQAGGPSSTYGVRGSIRGVVYILSIDYPVPRILRLRQAAVHRVIIHPPGCLLSNILQLCESRSAEHKIMLCTCRGALLVKQV